MKIFAVLALLLGVLAVLSAPLAAGMAIALKSGP
jgi:hypothetical protein